MEPGTRLQTVLQNYQQYIDGDKSGEEFQEEKSLAANRAMNIIATGIGRFNEEQSTALSEFRDRFSREHPEDRVVQLAAAAAEMQIGQHIGQEIHGRLDENLQSVIDAFKDITELESLEPRMRQRVTMYAAQRISNVLSDLPQRPNWKDMTKFAKIIQVSWKQLPAEQQGRLAGHLRNLLNAIEKDEKASAAEFQKVANNLVIQQQTEAGAPADIQECTFYHGEALEQGFEQLTDLIRKTGKEVSLQQFCADYARDQLGRGEYLLRNSSTVPSSDAEGTHFYTLTISYKDRSRGQVVHNRITRVEKDGDIRWAWGQPPLKKGQKTYPSIIALISTSPRLSIYRAKDRPGIEEMQAYVGAYAHPE